MYKITTTKNNKSISEIEFKNWDPAFEFFMREMSSNGIQKFIGHGIDVNKIKENTIEKLFTASFVEFSGKIKNEITIVMEKHEFTNSLINDISNSFKKIEYMSKIRFFLKSIDARRFAILDDMIELYEKNGHVVALVDRGRTFEILISHQFNSLSDAFQFIENHLKQ